jgi:CubicO group peptidase (beta-lactamase class C family)
MCLGAASAAAQNPFEWQAAAPESQGVSSTELEIIRKRMVDKKTGGFLVVRHDRIVCEWYAPGVTPQRKFGTASLAKALIGGLSLGVALEDQRLTLDDPAARFIPQWKQDVRKSRITIRQLGSHTSGLSDSTTEGVKHEEQPGWKGEFWRRLDPPNDPFSLARDQVPLLFDPGTQFQYSNPGIGLLTYCVTKALPNTGPRDARTILRERVFHPIGINDDQWTAGYGKTFSVDNLPLVPAWGGANFTTRATARIGRLVLRGGNWEGRQLFKPDVIRQITSDAGLIGHCGMGWWSNGGNRYRDLPKDAVWGAGAGDQLLLVVPSLNLIMVRFGETLAPGPEEPPIRKDDIFTQYHDYRARILFEPLARAIKRAQAAAPCLDSPVISDVRWAPTTEIVRLARGSDNWPVTWGNDDLLYAAYGDGNGFAPFTPRKLSMGLATITGLPPGIHGTNLRSTGIEATGEGAAGRKASGLLMVDGVLYMWARNVQNAQVAWSSDHGVTWTWSDWKFTQSFGCPTFLNFGANYAGARDDYVYVYSHDSDSAYQPADFMVLARVPKNRIRERTAYEFFQHIGPDHQPQWTPAIEQRGPVFQHPGNCYRSGITYNPGLKRYLWCQILPGSRHPQGPRFQGGFGVYDAPEPWGPWTTVYFTNEWDVGPGDSSSFPTKWMSTDGTKLHLVFSGDDCFSVRAVTLKASAQR